VLDSGLGPRGSGLVAPVWRLGPSGASLGALCYLFFMRVALDATYALDPQPTGVAHYSQRLIESLAVLNERDGEPPLTLLARPRRFFALCRRYDSGHYRRRVLQEPLNLLLPQRVDLYHGLNQRLPGYRFRRTVTTIHDVFPLSSESYSSPDFRSKFGRVIRDAVTRSDALIAVSAYTRDEVCRVLGVDPTKITVVHHGIDPPGAGNIRNAGTNGGGLYFLTVGVVQTRKNTLTAVRAIERLPSSVRLVVAGGFGYGAEETQDYVRRQGLSARVQFAGHCDQAALDRYYAGAVGLLFPSLEEGFGFPVLEAMARGLPVIASRAASIPEIAGDAALLFDPQDDRGMSDAAARLLDDPVFAAGCAARGRSHAAGFTWDKAAHQTWEVYRQTFGEA
jgi:glycosyltransferase involved in cell wall biosynthesis